MTLGRTDTDRELLLYLLAQYERVVRVHEQVVMDTPEDRELHTQAVAAMRRAVEPVLERVATQPAEVTP